MREGRGPLGPGFERRPGGRRGRRTRWRALAWGLRLTVLLVVFWLGVALGRALEQEPRPGGTQTLVRTLEPRTVAPSTRVVTVTTDTTR